MLLCFVDETFKGDFYGFVGVVASGQTTKALTAKLNQIVAPVAHTFGISRSTELHGYEIFHGKQAWSAVGLRARIKLYQDVVEAIYASDVCILLRSVSKSRLAERQAREHYPVNFTPEQEAFKHILQRVDKVAKREATEALVIADERGDRERHRERFSLYQEQGTPGSYMRTKLDAIVDTIHFAPSHQSRMLQAADMVAFVSQRRALVWPEPHPDAEKVMTHLYGSILAKCYDYGSWP